MKEMEVSLIEKFTKKVDVSESCNHNVYIYYIEADSEEYYEYFATFQI